jgi:cytochrome oxidase Cu insertion factor (SCO1/SenC/PrrC family)
MRARVLGAWLLVCTLYLAACAGGASDGDARDSEGPVVGTEAPGFSLKASDGTTVSLEEFAGRRSVLLYFSMGPG